jgi:hypothetical protein
MLYALINADGTFGGMTPDHKTAHQAPKSESRWDWKNLEAAQVIADAATKFHGVLYVATDAGSHVAPRYDVVKAPRVGDEVSYSFNGDTYPDGTIKSVSKTLKVVTTTSGRQYHRRRQTGSWVLDGTWSMVHGHRHERNPHI